VASVVEVPASVVEVPASVEVASPLVVVQEPVGLPAVVQVPMGSPVVASVEIRAAAPAAVTVRLRALDLVQALLLAPVLRAASSHPGDSGNSRQLTHHWEGLRKLPGADPAVLIHRSRGAAYSR
jgi:hypothetical protein